MWPVHPSSGDPLPTGSRPSPSGCLSLHTLTCHLHHLDPDLYLCQVAHPQFSLVPTHVVEWEQLGINSRLLLTSCATMNSVYNFSGPQFSPINSGQQHQLFSGCEDRKRNPQKRVWLRESGQWMVTMAIILPGLLLHPAPIHAAPSALLSDPYLLVQGHLSWPFQCTSVPPILSLLWDPLTSWLSAGQPQIAK